MPFRSWSSRFLDHYRYVLMEFDMDRVSGFEAQRELRSWSPCDLMEAEFLFEPT